MNTHTFAGLVVCGSCGANFSATLDRRRADGWRPSIYGCSQRRNSKTTCQNKWISDVTIGPFVFDTMPESEFLSDRNRLLKQLADIDSKLAEVQQQDLDETLISNEFQTKASYFLMLQSLIGDKPFDYEKYVKDADPDVPKSFINTVVS